MTGRGEPKEMMQAHSPHIPTTRARRTSFARGFRERSPFVLLAAAVFAGLALLALQVALVDGGLTAVSQGRLLRITNDDYLHVSYRVAQLKRHPPQGPTVYLFGGSGAMEMFVSERSLAAAIQRAGGGRVDVVSLSAHQESFAQTLAIIDNLPRGPAVLAIGLTPMRFCTAPSADAQLLSGRPLLLRSPRLDQLAPKLYGKSAPFGAPLEGFFDYTGTYLRERGQDGVLWGVRIPYAHHYYPSGSSGALPLAKRLNIEKVLARDSRNYAANGAYNLEMLRQIILLARERGCVVALYDQPLNTSAGGPTWAGVVPAYRRQVKALARREDVPYLAVARRVHLRDEDFADLYHLLGSGRAKWQPELARELSVVLHSLAGA